MHFLPDVYDPCEQCHGERYNRKTLELRLKGNTIANALETPIEEGLEFFTHLPMIRSPAGDAERRRPRLRAARPTRDTLFRGEAQRVELAAEPGKVTTGKTLYILELTTGPPLRRHRAPARGAYAASGSRQHGCRDRAQPRRDQSSDGIIDLGQRSVRRAMLDRHRHLGAGGSGPRILHRAARGRDAAGARTAEPAARSDSRWRGLT